MDCNSIFIFSPGLSKYCLHCGAGQGNPTQWLEQGRSSQTDHCPFVHGYSKVTIMQFLINTSAICIVFHVCIFLWLYGICHVLDIPRVLQVTFCENADFRTSVIIKTWLHTIQLMAKLAFLYLAWNQMLINNVKRSGKNR